MILLGKLRAFRVYCIVTIIMQPGSYWVNSEHSVSTAFLRSKWHDDLTEFNQSSLFLLHFYYHNGKMTSLNKIPAFCFHCIVSITMTRWSQWLNYENSVSTKLLPSKWHVELTEQTPIILFLLYCYEHNATMVLLSILRAFCFYCIVAVIMTLWSYRVN
jgi:hypothetical protein